MSAQPPPSGAIDDPSIPVLTERLYPPSAPAAGAEPASAEAPQQAAPIAEPGAGAAETPAPAEPAPPAGDAPEFAAAPVPTPTEVAARLDAEAAALRAAVLQRLAEALPEQVNAVVRDLMQPAIDQAMARLSEEAQVALRISLQELAEQVLRDELQRRCGDEPR